MTGAAVQVLNRETGEVQVTEAFDFGTYLDAIGVGGLERQQKMAAAYDMACAALIGPNDVQKEGNRTFKKKSAWRKLQRHFGISTSVTTVTKEWLEDEGSATFLATVTVRAAAPWGQSAESVGACGTDEETGRRKITIADAIATAETRATNRAVSNLIAMGEVSAEEMNVSRRGPPPPQAERVRAPADKLMPFGANKGKRLGDLPNDVLLSTVTWCREKDETKFASLIEACNVVLDGRRLTEDEVVEAAATRQTDGQRKMEEAGLDDLPEALQEEDDDLPF